MSSLPGKIVACILVVMLGISLIAATAGAVDQCVRQLCCYRSDMPIAVNEPTPAYDSAGHGCFSSSANISCKMSKNHVHDAQAFILSSVREELQKADGLITVAICEPHFLQKIIGKGTTNRFWITTNHTPIYLQNLSLLC
ncbi:MAG: hypothetical protein V3S72_02295 [Desulfobacterales bacterium]